MTPDIPWLDVEGYAGPLDHLIAQARSRHLNLAALPLRDLVAQLVEAIEAGLAAQRLAEPGDWLILACTLVQLRSALLLPEAAPQRQDAERTADALRRTIVLRARLADAARSLDRRSRLGRDVFARPAGGTAPAANARPTGIADLLDAGLSLLRQRDRRQAPPPAVAARVRPETWTISAAIAQLRGMLVTEDDPFSLGTLAAAGFPPEGTPGGPGRQRGAHAAALMATLELSRLGDLAVTQAQPWGDVTLCTPPSAAE